MKLFEVLEERIQFERNLDRQKGELNRGLIHLSKHLFLPYIATFLNMIWHPCCQWGCSCVDNWPLLVQFKLCNPVFQVASYPSHGTPLAHTSLLAWWTWSVSLMFQLVSYDLLWIMNLHSTSSDEFILVPIGQWGCGVKLQSLSVHWCPCSYL